MKKYTVREYQKMNDGSEFMTDMYTIAEEELDETREALDDLIGVAIDRYEID